jgi:peptidoglycan/LPS O-acetylase OafA/YrhL
MEEARSGSAEHSTAGAAARFRNVDSLRAVAALAVLCGHAYSLSGRVVVIQAEFVTDAFVIATATGVWLFFAVSGLVIARPYVASLLDGTSLPKVGRYALRRAVRIFPLYWVALGAAILVVGTKGAAAWELVAHFALLHNLVPGRQNAILSVAWTLTLELLFYWALPAAAAVVRRVRVRPTADGLSAAVLGTWIASIAWTAGADLLLSGDRASLYARQLFPSMAAMFCPGILLAIGLHAPASSRIGRTIRWIGGHRRRCLVLGSGLVVVGCCAAFIEVGSSLRVYLLLYDAARIPLAVGFGLIVAVGALSSCTPTRVNVVLWKLGDASYGLYLLHAVVLLVLLEHPGWILLGHRGGAIAYVAHAGQLLALSIPLALLSWTLLELPLLRRATRSTSASPTSRTGMDILQRQ